MFGEYRIGGFSFCLFTCFVGVDNLFVFPCIEGVAQTKVSEGCSEILRRTFLSIPQTSVNCDY